MTKGWMAVTIAVGAAAMSGCTTMTTDATGRPIAVTKVAPAGPAETAVLLAQARATEVDGRLHSIIALDPTAVAQARALDAGGRAGPLVG